MPQKINPLTGKFDFFKNVGEKGDQGLPGVVQTIVAGTNVSVDSTDPANPIVSSLQAETDPVFTAWDKSTGISITKSQVSDFPTIPAAQIQSDWNQTNNLLADFIKNKPSIPTQYTDAMAVSAVGTPWTSAGYLTEETDPVWTSEKASYSTKAQADLLYAPISVVNYTLPTASASVLGGVKIGSRLTIADGVLSADVQTTDISGKENVGVAAGLVSGHESTYDHALIATALQSETDPVFTAWDKSTGISITKSQVSDFGTYSTDIHSNITALNLVSGENTGDQTLPTRDSLGIDTDDGVQFARIGAGVTPDANRVFYSAATTGASLPLFERPSLTTNDPITCVYFLSTKTTDMGDGFGITNAFQIKDNAGTANTIGVIGFVRAGADNTGDFVVRNHVAGTQTERFRVSATGTSSFAGAVSSAGYSVGATAGIDATVALAKLTTGGANGSLTVTKGIITAYSAPT